MICNKCGCRIDEGSVFCPVCGSRQSDDTVLTSAALADPTSVTKPAPEPVPPAAASEPAHTAAPAPETARPAPRKRAKKEFFGTGAFVLCLMLILLLSASTGVFAYLYFAAIGAI